MDKIMQDDEVIDNYKTIVKNQEQEHNECRKTNLKLRDINKRLEKEIEECDNLLTISAKEMQIIQKEKNKIKNSIEMFFRLNENIIKEF